MGFLKKFGSLFGFGGGKGKTPKPAPYKPARYTTDIPEPSMPKGKSSFPKGQEPDKSPKGKTVFGTATKPAPFKPERIGSFTTEPSHIETSWVEAELTPLTRFLDGEFVTLASSNVAGARFESSERRLWVNYKDGSWYQYEDISEEEATGLFNAGSPGGWVWDHLRVRGTVFGFQKQYMLLDGPSPESARKWHADVPGAKEAEDKARWRREHGGIKEEGKTPDSWKAGQGPYPADYG